MNLINHLSYIACLVYIRLFFSDHGSITVILNDYKEQKVYIIVLKGI